MARGNFKQKRGGGRRYVISHPMAVRSNLVRLFLFSFRSVRHLLNECVVLLNSFHNSRHLELDENGVAVSSDKP